MALDINTMTEEQLRICIDKAYRAAQIQQTHENQANALVNDVYNDAINDFNNDRFSNIKRKYPKLYEYVQNQGMKGTISKRRWNKVLYYLSNPIITGLLFCGISWIFSFLVATRGLSELAAEIGVGLIMIPIIGVIAIRVFSDKLYYGIMNGYRNFRAKLKNGGQANYNARMNASVDTITDGAIVQIQSSEAFHQIIESQTNALVQDLSTVACYDAIPEPFRFYEMIERMKTLMDGRIASNWKELASKARQELHTEAQTQRIIDKLDEIEGKVNQVVSNQITMISQNDQIIAGLQRIENNQLATNRKLDLLNLQAADLNHLANNINRQIEHELGTKYLNVMHNEFYSSAKTKVVANSMLHNRK